MDAALTVLDAEIVAAMRLLFERLKVNRPLHKLAYFLGSRGMGV